MGLGGGVRRFVFSLSCIHPIALNFSKKGSKLTATSQLGIPTANIPVPDKEANHWINTAESGVYFGWAGIRLSPSHPDFPANSDAPLKPSTKILDSSFIPPKCAADIGQEKREEGWGIWPMVMSIGYNPFYKNEVRSAEVHVLHGFRADFYGCEMRLSLVGFIRYVLARGRGERDGGWC